MSGTGLRQAILATELVGDRVWVGPAPEDTHCPYICIEVSVTDDEALSGDGGTLAWKTMHEIHLIEATEDEDPALIEAIKAAVHGQRWEEETTLPWRIQLVAREEDDAAGIVHRVVRVREVNLTG